MLTCERILLYVVRICMIRTLKMGNLDESVGYVMKNY